jgi:hypothetical protein
MINNAADVSLYDALETAGLLKPPALLSLRDNWALYELVRF